MTSLYPVVSGRVAEVMVSENEPVAAGAPLLKVDDRLATIKVRQAQADLDAAQAQLALVRRVPEQHADRLAQQQSAVAAMQSKLAAARHGLTRKQNLHNAKHLAVEEVRAAEEQIKELEAALSAEQAKLAELTKVDPTSEVARAEAAVAAKQGLLDEARHQLDECTLRAPAAGSVLRLHVGIGDVLAARPTQPAVLFCPAKARVVRVEVEQEYAARVAANQRAVIEDDGHGPGRWQGRVVRLSDWYTRRRSVLNEPAQQNDVRTLECIVLLDAGQPQPRIGQRMRVTIGD